MYSHSYDKLVCIHHDIYSIQFKFPVHLLRICGSWVQRYIFSALTGQENGGWSNTRLFPFSISKMPGNLVQELVYYYSLRLIPPLDEWVLNISFTFASLTQKSESLAETRSCVTAQLRGVRESGCCLHQDSQSRNPLQIGRELDITSRTKELKWEILY